MDKELASDALERVRRGLRRKDAPDLLMNALREGKVRVTANARLIDHDVGPLPDSAPNESLRTKTQDWAVGREISVYPHFFIERAVSKFIEVSREWELSRFSSFGNNLDLIVFQNDHPPLTPARKRYTVYNTFFRRDDITSVIESYETKSAKERRVLRTRVELDSERISLTEAEWESVLLPLSRLAEAGRLGDVAPIHGRGSLRAFKDQIAELFVDDNVPSSSTLRRRALKLYDINTAAIVRLTNGST